MNNELIGIISNEGELKGVIEDDNLHVMVQITESGPRGLQGDDGYTPIKGVDYFDGEKGDKGDTGEKGDKGDTGEKGDKGEPGEVSLEQLKTKVDKIQESWAIPTLLNGWEFLGGHSCKYRRDGFGNLQLFGRLNSANATSDIAFVLPEGYRPSEIVVLLMSDNTFTQSALHRKLQIRPTGNVYINRRGVIVFAHTIPLGVD